MSLIILGLICLSLGMLGIIFVGILYFEWLLGDIIEFAQYMRYEQKVNNRFVQRPEEITIW